MAQPVSNPPSVPANSLPEWAGELKELYESDSANQFILYGNVDDEFLCRNGIGSIIDYLGEFLLNGFQEILIYDLGSNLRVLRGGDTFQEWKNAQRVLDASRTPRAAMEGITQYLRYRANLRQLGRGVPQVAVILLSADLLVPAVQNVLNYELSAIAMLVREWSGDPGIRRTPVASFLLTQNLRDLHPLIAGNSHAVALQVPLPAVAAMNELLEALPEKQQGVIAGFEGGTRKLASCLAGATLRAASRVLALKEHRGEKLRLEDVSLLRRRLVEEECGGLIEFIEPSRSLDDLSGQEALKRWLRQDLQLWRSGDLRAMPMGYLFCGPVGTGKTYAVDCLAGEAGVPVVKLKNFRDKWVGTTEGNLERIFRLLRALGQCMVFVDEADQMLGRREASSHDSGLSGRVYGMFAKEMSDTRNRGRIIWVLASSRPDLIEVDLKRPGRVDTKIPLFPTATAEEGFNLIAALANRNNMDLNPLRESILPLVPDLLTPGAAEVIAIKAYRLVKSEGVGEQEAMVSVLEGYQPPVDPEIIRLQIRLAVNESTDRSFVPERFLNWGE